MRSLRAGMAVLLLMALAQCMQATPPLPQGGQATITGATYQAPLNALRADHGLAPLTPDPRLGSIAAGHAQDMLDNRFFGHVSPRGGTLIDRARAGGYAFCHVAENLALGQTSFDRVLQMWMTSPLHRRNLLAEAPTQFGLARGPGGLWVLVQGQPGCANSPGAEFI